MAQADIDRALDFIRATHKAPISRAHKGFIIMAQDEEDYTIKQLKINRGITIGFYDIPRILDIISKSK